MGYESVTRDTLKSAISWTTSTRTWWFKKNSRTDDLVLTKYKAILLPPVLPKNAEEKKVSYNTSLKIYAKGNQNYVCIKNKNELDEAEKVSNELKAMIVFQAQ